MRTIRIKMLAVLIILISSIMISSNAYSWTTYPFQLGWADSYTTDSKQVEKIWNVTSMPTYLADSSFLEELAGLDMLNQIVLVRTIGEPDEVYAPFSRDNYVQAGMGREYDDAVKAMKQIAVLMHPYIQRATIVAIGYILELRTINLHFNQRLPNKRAIYEDMVEILNKVRLEKLSSGEYPVDTEILWLMENLRGGKII